MRIQNKLNLVHIGKGRYGKEFMNGLIKEISQELSSQPKLRKLIKKLEEFINSDKCPTIHLKKKWIISLFIHLNSSTKSICEYVQSRPDLVSMYSKICDIFANNYIIYENIFITDLYKFGKTNIQQIKTYIKSIYC